MRPKYGTPSYSEEYDHRKDSDIIEDAAEEDEHPGDWKETLATQQREETLQKAQQEQVMANVTLTSDPLYIAALSILTAMASNSSTKTANMSPQIKIAAAKQLANLFLEEMTND